MFVYNCSRLIKMYHYDRKAKDQEKREKEEQEQKERDERKRVNQILEDHGVS